MGKRDDNAGLLLSSFLQNPRISIPIQIGFEYHSYSAS